ncbi:phosphatidylinositol-specific phospholipase C/glycerophosphodiester phosphodiesterase family protein [Brucella lupini]
MIVIHHRRNTVAELADTDPQFGVEIDLRNHGDEILVTHDPFITRAVLLQDWLKQYRHRFLIANVKEEGLEPRLTALLAEYGVSDFFILDESIPFIRKYALEGLPNFAVRVSELESIETALRIASYLHGENRSINWIWADSFTGMPLHPDEALALRQAGYRICIVSPELHHVNDPASYEARALRYIEALKEPGMESSRPDMVCTKCPLLWGSNYSI